MFLFLFKSSIRTINFDIETDGDQLSIARPWLSSTTWSDPRKTTIEWRNAWTRPFIKNNKIRQKEPVHGRPCYRRPYPWMIKLYLVNLTRNSPKVLHKQNMTRCLVCGRNSIHFIPHTPFSSLATNITHNGDRSQTSRPTSNSL